MKYRTISLRISHLDIANCIEVNRLMKERPIQLSPTISFALGTLLANMRDSGQLSYPSEEGVEQIIEETFGRSLPGRETQERPALLPILLGSNYAEQQVKNYKQDLESEGEQIQTHPFTTADAIYSEQYQTEYERKCSSSDRDTHKEKITEENLQKLREEMSKLQNQMSIAKVREFIDQSDLQDEPTTNDLQDFETEIIAHVESFKAEEDFALLSKICFSSADAAEHCSDLIHSTNVTSAEPPWDKMDLISLEDPTLLRLKLWQKLNEENPVNELLLIAVRAVLVNQPKDDWGNDISLKLIKATYDFFQAWKDQHENGGVR